MKFNLNTLSNKTILFLNMHVIGKINGINSLLDINEDNINDIVDFIVHTYEIPLAEDQMEHKVFDKQLLDDATDVVTDITTQPWW